MKSLQMWKDWRSFFSCGKEAKGVSDLKSSLLPECLLSCAILLILYICSLLAVTRHRAALHACFLMNWFPSGLENGISSGKRAVGQPKRHALAGKGWGRYGKEKNGSHFLSVIANCWASSAREACWFVVFFFLWSPSISFYSYKFPNRCYRAVQANKLLTRSGFAQHFQWLAEFARVTCGRELLFIYLLLTVCVWIWREELEFILCVWSAYYPEIWTWVMVSQFQSFLDACRLVVFLEWTQDVSVWGGDFLIEQLSRNTNVSIALYVWRAQIVHLQFQVIMQVACSCILRYDRHKPETLRK